MSSIKYMREALKEAEKALEFDEIPVGALVVKDDEIIGRGFNRRDTDDSPFAHAELLAIQQAAEKLGSWRLDGCTLYVTLEPCPMCAGAIVQCRLKALVYGAKDSKAGAAGSLYNIPADPRFAHSCKVTGGVLKNECSNLLNDFFKNRRRRQKKQG
ncbi:MAG: tRNA adenosine(34) deaminase TadA [Synergistaceae bacterium]|nr:tRNA adenosine(34) deaminase TadA [Synergistaceae bacterium]